MHYFVLNFLGRSTKERHLTTDEIIKNATKAPKIALEVARLLLDDLRCLIPKGSSILYEILLVLEGACQTKVSNFDLWPPALTTQKDVLVLNVTMYNLLCVNIL